MTKELKQLIIGGMVLLGVIGVVTGVVLYKQSSAPTESEAMVRSTSHATGATQAKVTLVEFGDFQCPACGEVEPILEQLRTTYAGKSVRFVFRNYPLSSLHPNAEIAAEAAEAAGAQGKFWEMHDLLYNNQSAWVDLADPTKILVSYAKQLGLTVDTFTSTLKDGIYQSIVRADQKDGDVLGIDATPTFFLNGQRIVGGEDYNTFKSKIDSLLKT